MSTTAEKSFAEVWERTIQPNRALTPAAAHYLLQLRFADSDIARMDQLAAKARAGSLTGEEESELENYMQLGWFLDLLRSKSRLALGPAADA